MDERSWRLVGLLLLCGAVGIGLWWGLAGSADPIPLALAEVSSEAVDTPTTGGEPEVIVVHVAGAVVRPGLVELGPGARVADAIAAAGGLTSEAVDTAVNLAAPVSDGAQVVVPSRADGGAVDAPAYDDDGLVHVNQASISELEALPGVGPVLAERIAAYRDENGPFGVAEDLLDVPGIGESKLDAMREALAIP